ncbi:Triosephosphate isomerase [Xylariaceae sp. AK1471]|nr:Triosephosphate isomerase [Xylariaceae sp. AK1471]
MPPSSQSSRRRLVGVSTKMYFSYSRTINYITALLEHLADISDDPTVFTHLQEIDVFIIPDHITLINVIAQLNSHPFDIPFPILPGAQDAYHEDFGSFTGEVSTAVLAEVGCRILEINHAERRRLFGETDSSAALKAAAAVRNGLIPLVCVGERTRPQTITESDSEHSSSEEKAPDLTAALLEIRTQVEAVLSATPDMSEVILAYEPVWAIGAAAPASASYVVAMTQAIRDFECVRRRTGSTRILYGGSAGPGLFEKLKDSVDGLFLGRFAHDPEQFKNIILEVATA